MPSGTERRQHLRLQETQLEMSPRPSFGENEDYDGKLRDAQAQLDHLQRQREELEEQRALMQELTQRKEEFINGQIEMTERFTASITAIDREVFELRQELEDLEQTRQTFAAHLDRIEKIEPESWPREVLDPELKRAHQMLEQAEEEFEGVVAHFATGRSRDLFGGSPGRRRKSRSESDFVTSMKSGLAFNLPVMLLGTLALVIYLLK